MGNVILLGMCVNTLGWPGVTSYRLGEARIGKVLVKEAIFSPAVWQEELYGSVVVC